jgi:Leucine Rich repeat
MMDALAKTNIHSLDISRNVIEDETLIMLGNLYKEGASLRLATINFSSCHITDVGLLYFMESIYDVECLKSVTVRDNFVSESCEKLLLDLIEKNEFLTEFELKGNRISMSCLSRIAQKLKRNVHNQEMRKPNLLKNEVYRLNFEKDKVMNAEKNINKVLENISRAVSDKEHHLDELQRFRDGENKRRSGFEEKIIENEVTVEKKVALLEIKKEDRKQLQRENDSEHGILAAKNLGKMKLKHRSCR